MNPDPALTKIWIWIQIQQRYDPESGSDKDMNSDPDKIKIFIRIQFRQIYESGSCSGKYEAGSRYDKDMNPDPRVWIRIQVLDKLCNRRGADPAMIYGSGSSTPVGRADPEVWKYWFASHWIINEERKTWSNFSKIYLQYFEMEKPNTYSPEPGFGSDWIRIRF